MLKFKKSWLIPILIITISCNTSSTESADEGQEAIEKKIVGTEVTYATDSTEMIGYIVYDENQEGKRPGIIVVHE